MRSGLKSKPLLLKILKRRWEISKYDVRPESCEGKHPQCLCGSFRRRRSQRPPSRAAANQEESCPNKGPRQTGNPVFSFRVKFLKWIIQVSFSN